MLRTAASYEVYVKMKSWPGHKLSLTCFSLFYSSSPKSYRDVTFPKRRYRPCSSASCVPSRCRIRRRHFIR